MYEKGDIIRGIKTVHPVIFLRKKDEYYFYGCILTHSNSYENNIALLPEHFITHDINKNEYLIVYDNSYFVNLILIKKSEWGPFKKVGKLSKSGIKHLEKQLMQSDIIEWKEYINKK